MPVLESFPTKSFWLFTRTTEKMWTYQGAVKAVNAHSACEMWLYAVKNGSRNEAVYDIAIIPPGEAEAAPPCLTEAAINEHSTYLYSGDACIRLPKHLQRFSKKQRKK